MAQAFTATHQLKQIESNLVPPCVASAICIASVIMKFANLEFYNYPVYKNLTEKPDKHSLDVVHVTPTEIYINGIRKPAVTASGYYFCKDMWFYVDS